MDTQTRIATAMSVVLCTLGLGVLLTAGASTQPASATPAPAPAITCTLGIIPFEDGSYSSDAEVTYDGEVIADAWVVDDWRIADSITVNQVTGVRTLHTAWSPGYRDTACTVVVVDTESAAVKNARNTKGQPT